jgi:hypothetical protein
MKSDKLFYVILTVIILTPVLVYNHFQKPNEEYIHQYFRKLIEYSKQINQDKIQWYSDFIIRSSYVEPIYRRLDFFRENKRDPYRYVEGKVDRD